MNVASDPPAPKPTSWAWAWIPLGVAGLGFVALVAPVAVSLFAWVRELPLHPPPSLAASALSRIPSGDHGSYYLTGVDGAIGADGRVHVLWRAFDEVRDRDELWYAHSEPGASG